METITINTESANFTEEQFFRLCLENKGLRFERDSNKQIYIMSPTGGLTSNRNVAIASRVYFWNEQLKNGYVFESSGGFILSNGAMRSPDVSWVEKYHWDALPLGDRERFPHICPDFIIEILSKSDSLKQLQNKMQEWITNGCQLGWLIDFENKNIFVYRPDMEVQIIDSFDFPISGEDVLPGFELNLKDID